VKTLEEYQEEAGNMWIKREITDDTGRRLWRKAWHEKQIRALIGACSDPDKARELHAHYRRASSLWHEVYHLKMLLVAHKLISPEVAGSFLNAPVAPGDERRQHKSIQPVAETK
jgi:hypothetical protein